MSSHLTQLLAVQRIEDQRRAAEQYHLAVVAANETRQERAPRLPALRAHRSLLGRRKRFHLA
jgi:hypothetical protein